MRLYRDEMLNLRKTMSSSARGQLGYGNAQFGTQMMQLYKGEIPYIEIADDTYGKALELNKLDTKLEEAQIPQDSRREMLSEILKNGMNPSNVFNGFAAGLLHGDDTTRELERKNVMPDDPGAKFGVALAKLGKFSLETGLMAALPELGLVKGLATAARAPIASATGKLLTTISKADKASIMQKALPALKTAGDWAGAGLYHGSKGAASGVASNLATNELGSFAGEKLSGGQAQVDQGAMGIEAGVSGLLTGGLNIPFGLGKQNAATRLAALQTAQDVDAYGSAVGKRLQGHVGNVDANAEKVLGKIGKAYMTELAPVKAGLDAAEIAMHNTPSTVFLKDLDQGFVKYIKDLGQKTGTKSQANIGVVQDMKSLFEKYSDQLVPLGGGRGVVLKKGVAIPYEDLKRIDDLMESLHKVSGASPDNAALYSVKKKLTETNATKKLRDLYPDQYKKAKQEYQDLRIKYGDPGNDQGYYKELNKFYDSIEAGAQADINPAHIAEILTQSTPQSRAMNKQMGKFVDLDIITPNDIGDLFVGKVAASSGGSKATTGAGRIGGVKKLGSGRVSPYGAVDQRAQENLLTDDIKTFGDVSHPTGEDIVNPFNYGSKILKADTKDAIRASLGQKGSALADNIINRASRLQTISKNIPRIKDTSGMLNKIFNINQGAMVSELPGAALVENQYSTKSLLSNLNRSKGVAKYTPPAAREIGQDLLGMLSGGNGDMGPVSLPLSALTGGWDALNNKYNQLINGSR